MLENFSLLLPNKSILGEIREIPFGVVGLGLTCFLHVAWTFIPSKGV